MIQRADDYSEIVLRLKHSSASFPRIPQKPSLHFHGELSQCFLFIAASSHTPMSCSISETTAEEVARARPPPIGGVSHLFHQL